MSYIPQVGFGPGYDSWTDYNADWTWFATDIGPGQTNPVFNWGTEFHGPLGTNTDTTAPDDPQFATEGPQNEIILGGSGNDLLLGWTGNDYIDGGADHDKLSGHDGNDVLLGGAGNDQILGGLGDDFLAGGPEGLDAGTTERSGAIRTRCYSPRKMARTPSMAA